MLHVAAGASRPRGEASGGKIPVTQGDWQGGERRKREGGRERRRERERQTTEGKKAEMEIRGWKRTEGWEAEEEKVGLSAGRMTQSHQEDEGGPAPGWEVGRH